METLAVFLTSLLRSFPVSRGSIRLMKQENRYGWTYAIYHKPVDSGAETSGPRYSLGTQTGTLHSLLTASHLQPHQQQHQQHRALNIPLPVLCPLMLINWIANELKKLLKETVPRVPLTSKSRTSSRLQFQKESLALIGFLLF